MDVPDWGPQTSTNGLLAEVRYSEIFVIWRETGVAPIERTSEWMIYKLKITYIKPWCIYDTRKRHDDFLQTLIGAYSGRSLELTNGIPLLYQTHQLVKPGGHQHTLLLTIFHSGTSLWYPLQRQKASGAMVVPLYNMEEAHSSKKIPLWTERKGGDTLGVFTLELSSGYIAERHNYYIS
ncbi:hypothetical protein BDR06DRAFT_966356 [Suillus hirtellus]|nr:hypothetical protein BDR06DRAFT_966356 [Suillus hirtellus]